jgi:protein-disulfide isomerase/uncharacterized membrane protein
MGRKQGLYSFLVVLRGLLPVAGLYAAGVLTITFLEGINVPCGESAGCELVAKSPISAPGGIPIALVGSIAYVLLIISGFAALGKSNFARASESIGYALAGVGSLVSVGLTLYSIRVIGATCRWCLASMFIFCATLILYALCASSQRTISDLSARLGKLLIAGATCFSLSAIGITGNLIEYEPPIVNAKVLIVTRHEDLVPDRAPSMGDKHADYTMVFFGDLQCRTCKEALPLLAKEIAATPHTRLVYRYYPLSIHDFAKEAAIAAESSKKTVGFWPFVWKLYSNPDYLDLSYLREVERWARLGSKVDDGQFVDADAEKQVDADHDLGLRLGLKETPTIIIIQGGKMKAVSYRAALDDIRAYKKADVVVRVGNHSDRKS